MSMIDENSIWCDGFSSVAPSTHWASSDVIPTPPRSPCLDTDRILGLEAPFTTVDMVNPNAILDESHREATDNVRALSLSVPLLDDIKVESLDIDTVFDELMNPMCGHGFQTQGFCNTCFEENFKTEIVNDCMWPSGNAVALDTQPSVNPPAYPSTSYSRTHLDSVSSRYSDALDPLAGSIANLDADDLCYSTPRLETPSESSDTDTDVEENITPAETVRLDHNYHFSNTNHKGDITSPLMKALNKVSMSQNDSDAEIDVVNLGSQESLLPTLCVPPKYHGSVSFVDAKGTQNLGATVTVGAPAKRGRKPGSGRGRGRPCKNVKRLNGPAKAPRTTSRGVRAVPMDPLKRNLHNSMERMRRVDLKNCFETVRKILPTLKDRARAPKVQVLKQARETVRNLQRSELRKRKELDKLRHNHSILKFQLQRLKQELGLPGHTG